MNRLLILAALGSLLSAASAANWPHWRGPAGDGTCEETGLPEKWSREENIAWRIDLPDDCNSTPIVWGGKVFITQAVRKTNERLLMCIDRKDGKLLWKKGTVWDKPELTHSTNPPCASSPTTDGERVFAWFGSAGIFCHDMNGKELWKRDLGKQEHIWGYGTSPVLHGGLCILNFGPGERQFLVALDKKTGREVWRQNEPGGDGGHAGGKSWLGSWSDPIVRSAGGRDELIMSWPGRLCALDPKTGKELWTSQGLTPLVYNSPVFADGVAIAMCGYGGSGLAVRIGGKGNVTESHRVWHIPRLGQRIGSGVVHQGHHYILTDNGMAECRDLKNGELQWSERLKGPGANGGNWSSLMLSEGKCYGYNKGGDTFVFRANPDKLDLIATNSLGEFSNSSIAPSDGQLFIRTFKGLWCVGKK